MPAERLQCVDACLGRIFLRRAFCGNTPQKYCFIWSTSAETLSGLTAENIRTMHVRQESGAMMGKQVLVVQESV